MKMRISQNALRVFLLAVLFLLAGCRTELFSQISENEANEMVALLLKHDIDAEKVTGKKETASVWVSQSDMGQAIQLLKENGYPKEKFSSLGTIFTKEGLISSPLEERARYVYAVSQELSETFSNLDGVLTARVHVVLPDPDNSGEIKNPSSASVFIKYTEGSNLQAYIPQIKLLVNNSIEGLDYEKISVVLFPSHKPSVELAGGSSITQSVFSSWEPYLMGALLIVILLGVGGIVFFILKRKAK